LTKEKCHEEALKYKTRSEFQKNNGSSYARAAKSKWLDEICFHMKYLQLPNGYWTKEKCHEEARKYRTRSEFKNKSAPSYKKAWENKWLNEICSHMKLLQLPNGHWTKGKCQEEARKYKMRREFQKNSAGAYNAARINGWLDEVCADMIQFQKPANYWTKEKCKEEAVKYKTRTEFQNNSRSAYSKAQKRNWLNEVCSNMTSVKKSNDYWTKEKCQEEASKCKTRGEFQKKAVVHIIKQRKKDGLMKFARI